MSVVIAEQDRIAVLRDYSAGRRGTRRTIGELGLRDHADLVIELARNDLGLPKPADTPARRRDVERARALLLPRLQRDA